MTPKYEISTKAKQSLAAMPVTHESLTIVQITAQITAQNTPQITARPGSRLVISPSVRRSVADPLPESL